MRYGQRNGITVRNRNVVANDELCEMRGNDAEVAQVGIAPSLFRRGSCEPL